MKTTKCPDCGYAVPGDLNTCPECGCPVEHQPEQPEQPQASQAQAQPQAQPQGQAQPQPQYYVSQQAPLESEWNGSLSSLARVDLPHYIYESFRIANSTFYQRMFCFSGYASRREFWSFYFFWQFIPLAFALLFPICLLLFVLAFFPALGVTIRRLHDNDHSGWWVFVPCYALFYCLQSNNPENEDEYPED